jgi:hypothetical protein
VQDWKEYLACCHPLKPFRCRTLTLCDRVGGEDVFAGKRRFSPRRSFGLATIT